MAVTEHWNYADDGKDFVGGYAFMSSGSAADGMGADARNLARAVGRGATC